MNNGEIPRLLDRVPEALILLGDDGLIGFANQAAERLFGYARHELVGARPELLVPERLQHCPARQRPTQFWRPAHRLAGSVEVPFAALHKEGREIPVTLRLAPFPTENGPQVLAAVRDLTAEQASEQKLRDALAELKALRDQLIAENVYLQEEIRESHHFEEMIGTSPALKATLHKMGHVAPTDANVLILGETGTGKELVARGIHARSRRKDHPLVKVNCAGLPSGLIESEMFGHEKGAFTGALLKSIGRFELADGGTIFLDEIGELEPAVQAKLLRVLQGGEMERLGSGKTIRVDVRVIAATNRDLARATREGGFRADLYFRLAVFPIEVPPLRQRREDIPLLVRHFVANNQAKLGKTIDRIPRRVMDALTAYDWPGNVRELENMIERAMILSPGTTLVLPGLLDESDDQDALPECECTRLEAVERAHILKTLQERGWKVKGKNNAADRLGLKPSTLHFRMRKLGIERPR